MIYTRNCNKNVALNLIQGARALEDDRLDLVCGGIVPGDGGCIPPWLDKLIHHLPIPLPTFPKL
jgi:hypothetical protein